MDPQLQQRLMIFGGFAPGIISLLLLIAAWYIHRRMQSRNDKTDGKQSTLKVGPRWVLPIMLALGFIGADIAANYKIHLWPDGNNYRFVHAIFLIAIVGVLEGFFALPLLAAFALRFIAYLGAFWMLAEGYTQTVFGNMLLVS